jgi:hypothetical protein
MCKKIFRTKTIRGKTFINIWITKVKLFWKKKWGLHLKPRSESFWGVLSCCLTLSILFNFRSKKIKTYGYFIYVSFVPVRVLHKDEKILGRKHIYLPHAQTAIYDSKVNLLLKQGINIPSTWSEQSWHHFKIKNDRLQIMFKHNLV